MLVMCKPNGGLYVTCQEILFRWFIITLNFREESFDGFAGTEYREIISRLQI